jgi:hypothetical protein
MNSLKRELTFYFMNEIIHDVVDYQFILKMA